MSEISTQALNLETLLSQLPKRTSQTYKGDCGCVLIVGGHRGMAGAPMLAAKAAYRVGAGLVKVATHPEHVSMPTLYCPEVQTFAVSKAKQLEELVAKATVIVVGPGLGQDSWSKELWRLVLSSQLPLVVDADALRLLAQGIQVRDNWILTPHVGEAAALLGTESVRVLAQRETSVLAIQKRFHGVAVLKGHHTLLASSASPVRYCPAGNAGMATAGMGDVLSGVIGGLLAQGMSLIAAAELGVYLHAKAGDQVAKEKGERGLMASDLYPYLQASVNGK